MIRYFKCYPFKLILSASCLSILPSLMACLFLLSHSGFDRLEKITLLVIVFVLTFITVYCFYVLLLRPWQSTANMIRSCMEDDFSQRMSYAKPSDPIGLVGYELNELTALLQSSRFKFIETRELLLKVLDSVDVSVFLFDHRQRVVMSNRAGAALFHVLPEQLLGKTVQQLDFNFAYMALPNTSHEHQFPAKKSKWLVKRSHYRDAGFSHSMILLDDIGSSLREEELTAWKRLIRVLSHEINNSMTPMKATVGGLQRMLRGDLNNKDWQDDFNEGLMIIERRVENLSHHVQSYSQIARQPQPRKNWFSLSNLCSRILETYESISITFNETDDLCLFADESQVEQVLTNVINNAEDSGIDERKNTIVISWEIQNNMAYFFVTDCGCGIDNFDNIFIPYFTTKKQGSGVGLFVSRQIVEAHDGFMHIENKPSKEGCVVTIVFPMLVLPNQNNR